MCLKHVEKEKLLGRHNYGCSFDAKLSWKKIFFFFLKKHMCFLQKYTLFAEKMFLYEKKVLYWKTFLLKKTFFTEKNINGNVKKYKIYLIWEIYFYAENVCVANNRQIFLKYIFILLKKEKCFIIRNIFVKTSLWTQQSGP